MPVKFIRVACVSLILFIIFPWVIMATLAWLWQGIDWLGSQLWPAVLNGNERGYLSGLWLVSTLLTGAMVYVAIRRRKLGYVVGAGAAVASLLLLTSLNMPLTPEAERRWAVGHQLERREWQQASVYSSNQFNQLIESFPGEVSVLRVLIMLQRNKTAFPYLAYLPEDSERVNNVWQDALSTPEPDIKAEASALSKMQDAIVWMPDQAELLLANGLFNLTAVYQSGLTLVSSRAIGKIFQLAIQSNPQDADAWTGWALTQLLMSETNNHLSYGIETPRLQQVTNALMAAVSLENKGKYQPKLHRRLQQFIATLPEKERRELHILQARATLLAGSSEPFDPAVIEQANQNLIPVSSETIGNQKAADDVGEINRVVSFERGSYLGEAIREALGENRDKLTTMLSVDVNARGEPVTVLPFVSSGVRQVDQAAIRTAYSWHFPASNQPQHRFTSVDFVNTELSIYAYLQGMQGHIATLATLVARHDVAGFRQQEALIRVLRSKVSMRQQSYGLEIEDVVELNKLLVSRRIDEEYYTTAIEKMQSLLGKYPQNSELLLLLAQQQMRYFIDGMRYDSPAKQQATSSATSRRWASLLLDARRNFGLAIAIEPTRADAWYGWGLTWVDEDPEILVGAIAYSNRLIQFENIPISKSEAKLKSVHDEVYEQEKALKFMKIRILVGMSLMHERDGWLDILFARISHNYQDMLLASAGQMNEKSDNLIYLDPKEVAKLREKVAIRPLPFPASFKRRLPEDPQAMNYLAGIVSVNFDEAGITPGTRSLPLFPDAGAQSAGVKTVVIDLDVNARGEPQLVLISSSSGVALYDEAALAASWRWRFAMQPADHLQRVTVSFRR